MGDNVGLTVDQHHLALDDAIGTSPVLFLGEVESILPRVSISISLRCRFAYLSGHPRRGCDGLIVGVDVELVAVGASEPALAISLCRAALPLHSIARGIAARACRRRDAATAPSAAGDRARSDRFAPS